MCQKLIILWISLTQKYNEEFIFNRKYYIEFIDTNIFAGLYAIITFNK